MKPLATAASIAYGIVGLTPVVVEGVVAKVAGNAATKANQLASDSYKNFLTGGIKATPDVMASPQAQALIARIQMGSPGLPAVDVYKYAAGYIESGTALPQIGIAAPGSVLLKAVTAGDGVSKTSGYWMSLPQAQAIATMTPEQAGQLLGLPASQAAKIQQGGMDFFAITPKTGATPVIFTSQVAPTTQGNVTMVAGGQQVIVPDRTLWTTPSPVNPFTLNPVNSLPTGAKP